MVGGAFSFTHQPRRQKGMQGIKGKEREGRGAEVSRQFTIRRITLDASTGYARTWQRLVHSPAGRECKLLMDVACRSLREDLIG
jgi:hypothetical protein